MSNTLSPYYSASTRIAMGDECDARRLSRIPLEKGRPKGKTVRVTELGQLQWCSPWQGGLNLDGFVSKDWAEAVTTHRY